MDNKQVQLRVHLYKEMLRIRTVEERLIELFNSGEVTSPIHLSIGQEAVAVGVCSVLDKKDLVVSTHRCHAHYLAKSGSLHRMIAELCGKLYGCSKGRAGSMLLSDPDVGMMMSSALVGGSIPIAVGLAWANKLRNKQNVAVAFFGDGAVEEGVFWESLNFASVFKLPIIFVCENNLYATHSHILKRQPANNIYERVRPHKVYAKKVDGNDVMAVRRLAKEMKKYSLKHGPSFIEARTYRWKEHWGPNEDSNLGYRTQEEIDIWKAKCPIKRMKNRLDRDGFDKYSLIDRAIEVETASAISCARRSPEPGVLDLLTEEGYDGY